jgi:hypothetical protein
MICHVADTRANVREPRVVKRMIRIGDFYTNGRELYEVLLVQDGRATMENCRTEFCTEYDYSTVRRMKLVRSGSDDGLA